MSANAKQARKKTTTKAASAVPVPLPKKTAAKKSATSTALPEAVTRKFLLRAKNRHISASVHKPMNHVMRTFVQDVLKHALTFAALGNRSTLKARDVQRSFEILGVEIY